MGHFDRMFRLLSEKSISYNGHKKSYPTPRGEGTFSSKIKTPQTCNKITGKNWTMKNRRIDLVADHDDAWLRNVRKTRAWSIFGITPVQKSPWWILTPVIQVMNSFRKSREFLARWILHLAFLCYWLWAQIKYSASVEGKKSWRK